MVVSQPGGWAAIIRDEFHCTFHVVDLRVAQQQIDSSLGLNCHRIAARATAEIWVRDEVS